MRYNFPIAYGPKTVFYDLSNGTDRKLVVSNRISLGILDINSGAETEFPGATKAAQTLASSFKYSFTEVTCSKPLFIQVFL